MNINARMEIFIYNKIKPNNNWYLEVLRFFSASNYSHLGSSIFIEKTKLRFKVKNYDIANELFEFLTQKNYDFIVINYNREPQNITEIFFRHSASNKIFKTTILHTWWKDRFGGQTFFYRIGSATTLRIINLIYYEDEEILIKYFFKVENIANTNCPIFQFQQTTREELSDSIFGHYDDEIGFMNFIGRPHNHILDIFSKQINVVVIYKNRFINYNNSQDQRDQMHLENDFDNRFYDSLDFSQNLYPNKFHYSTEHYLISDGEQIALFNCFSAILVFENISEYSKLNKNDLRELIKKSDLINILKLDEDESSITIIRNPETNFYLDQLIGVLDFHEISCNIKYFQTDKKEKASGAISDDDVRFFELCKNSLMKYLEKA